MAVISKIEALPRMKRRLVIFSEEERLGVLDGKIVREAGLDVGKNRTEEMWKKLLEKEKAPALDGALYYLGLKARTRHELELYFKRRQYASEVIAAVMERLEDYGFVDDEELSRRAVESLSHQKMGRGAIERKLRMRGVDKETAREALEDYDPEEERESAREMARLLWEKYRRDELPKRKQKTAAALARRGFSWESIRDAMRGLDCSDTWEYD